MSTISTLTPQRDVDRTAAGRVDAGLQRPLTAPFLLDHWLVDPDLNQVQLHGRDTIRHLEPRLMRLLCYFAANPGRVMPRETLVQELWPRVVVNENSLTRAVSDLRKQLRHPDGAPCKTIQTIPKRGYRLDAVIAPAATANETRRRTLLARPPVYRHLGTAAAAACLSLLVGLGLFSGGGLPTSPERPLLADEVVTGSNTILGEVLLSSTEPGDERRNERPVVAPDGERFAYIKRDLSGYTLYIGRLDGESEPVAIYSSPTRLSNLAWSPVGNALLFARHDAVTPAAVFDGEAARARLLSLDLDNGQLHHLVEDKLSPESDEAPRVNLTALDPDWAALISAPAGLPG